MKFKDKVVLITGAAVGIGREAALAFAREGATVVINYSKSVDEANETLRQVKELGGEGIVAQADVANETAVRQMFEDCAKRYGHIDILVNNAGVTAFIPFSDLEAVTDSVWSRLLDTNVKGTFFCSREAAKWMKPDRKPAIINISSQAGIRPIGSSMPYSVSKAAVIHMNECLALTLAPQIRVNCVAPGPVDNTRWNKAKADFDHEKYVANAQKSVPLGRVGEPADIAAAILFLAEENNFCTGVTLSVDGGNFLK